MLGESDPTSKHRVASLVEPLDVFVGILGYGQRRGGARSSMAAATLKIAELAVGEPRISQLARWSPCSGWPLWLAGAVAAPDLRAQQLPIASDP